MSGINSTDALLTGMQKYVLKEPLPSLTARHCLFGGHGPRHYGGVSRNVNTSCRFKRQKLFLVQQGKRDPLDADIWDSWQSEEDDWDTEKFTEDELIDILFDVGHLAPTLGHSTVPRHTIPS